MHLCLRSETIGTPLLYCLLLRAKKPKQNRKVASEKYFDVDYLRSDQSFKASRSALDESQSYLLSHFWTHLVCVYESVCERVCGCIWVMARSGSGMWSHETLFFFPLHHQAAGQKHIVYSKFFGLYSIMTVATPLPPPPPPMPLYRCPISAAFESMYNHVGGFSEGYSSIALSFAL